MKKLMIAACAVALAAAAQAATATWGSGQMYYNGDGSALDGSSGGSLVGDGTTKMYVFSHLDSGDYETITGWTNQQFFEAFVEAGINSTLTIDGTTYTMSDTGFNYGTSKNGAVSAGQEGGYSKRDDVYGAAVILYDGNLDGTIDAYSSSYASEEGISTTGPNFDGFALDKNFEGIASTWTATATPTPEPTSGLLLLLGVAGLALRRRRA